MFQDRHGESRSEMLCFRSSLLHCKAQLRIQPSPRRAADLDPATKQKTGRYPEFRAAGIGHCSGENMGRAEPAYDNGERDPCGGLPWKRERQQQ